MSLRRFIPVYGGKRSIAHLYPPPQHQTIIEPFAGGAGYSIQYPHLQVKLNDLDERVCAVWDFLIHAHETEILSIPVDIDCIDGLPTEEILYLVGWWMGPAAAGGPSKRAYSWSKSHEKRSDVWSETCRARLAYQVRFIRHWTIQQGSYKVLDTSEPATWFVDPPYQEMGVHYRKSSTKLDFEHLGTWCQALPGQTIVCENEGATWLPFQTLCSMTGAQRRRRLEVYWAQPAADTLF